MGIQGLLPFVKNASRPANIKDFKGCTAAVDTYCWLHKGAFSCAERLIKGEQTDGYISYVIKMANMLISAGIHPILVFDGQRLPSKKKTEEKRREQREMNRKKAKQFLVEGKLKEARECYQRAVDITPEMAFDVIQACRSRGINYIVAPYEADAQLAYFVKAGIADIVITEDSDLILFGCDKIIFKMDQGGNGVIVEASNLGKCLGNHAEKFTHEKFRQMCILSGCDYLSSLPGIGLAKALKFFKLITNPDLRATLPKLPVYLKMPQLNVTEEYIEGFLRAENTFLYQLVFCPSLNKLVPLNPYPPGIKQQELTYAGKHLSDEQAFQIAVGNINVNTHATIDFYSPPNRKVLQDHNTVAQKDVKRTKLGAFEPITRSLKDSRHVLKTPPKRAQSLPTKENKSPEKQQTSQARTTSLIDTRFVDQDDEDFEHKPESCIKQPKQNSAEVSTPPVNIFKVASKPPVLRSRFFSAPPKCSRKGGTDRPLSLLQSLETNCETPKSTKDTGRTFSKFQWRRTSFSETFDTQQSQASSAALTPFKKLRMNMTKTLKEIQMSSEDLSSRTSDSQKDEEKHGDQVELPEVQSDNVAGTVPMHTQIRNPFAKKPSTNSSSFTTSSKVELPLSDDEDPIPKTELQQGTPDHKRSRQQFELEFEDSSPILEERICSRELEENGNLLRGCCEDSEKSDNDETPLPTGRSTESEEIPSGINNYIIVEDNMEAEITPCRGTTKTFLQSRPTKKVMPKIRRLGLMKTKAKKDACQPSIVETLAKYKFKRNQNNGAIWID